MSLALATLKELGELVIELTRSHEARTGVALRFDTARLVDLAELTLLPKERARLREIVHRFWFRDLPEGHCHEPLHRRWAILDRFLGLSAERTLAEVASLAPPAETVAQVLDTLEAEAPLPRTLNFKGALWPHVVERLGQRHAAGALSVGGELLVFEALEPYVTAKRQQLGEAYNARKNAARGAARAVLRTKNLDPETGQPRWWLRAQDLEPTPQQVIDPETRQPFRGLGPEDW